MTAVRSCRVRRGRRPAASCSGGRRVRSRAAPGPIITTHTTDSGQGAFRPIWCDRVPAFGAVGRRAALTAVTCRRRCVFHCGAPSHSPLGDEQHSLRGAFPKGPFPCGFAASPGPHRTPIPSLCYPTSVIMQAGPWRAAPCCFEDGCLTSWQAPHQISLFGQTASALIPIFVLEVCFETTCGLWWA